ncbi:rhodanese-like domain-containing protein [Halopenitus sp. POP-27]|uniref:rhodanese-like domain-containing protein n=1 Tax=Halopenitus sp. POP-27 TaxID=2994425 RepID=UPI002468A06A|nr:rhodanese-like domain-containing protein [Halopenitus sp. POP-27]
MSAEIDVDELEPLIESEGDSPAGSLVIVDIRSTRAFDRGHIPGSRNVPAPELRSRLEEVADADRIVTVCPHGISSQQAADLIASSTITADVTVESLRGGLAAWDGPMETAATDTGSADEGLHQGSADEGPRREPTDEGPRRTSPNGSDPEAPF